MVNIKEIKLDNFILPKNGIGMVMMQPFVELCKNEPFRWIEDKKAKQIERIIRTLEIAKVQKHGCEKTHFTIFPEYSIPGLEGINKIQELIEDSSWKDGTVVIGGIDGLNKSEYLEICNSKNTEVFSENRPEKVRDDQWVNCCVFWLKGVDPDGKQIIKRWIQPKLCPSWPEENIEQYDLFEGKCVNIFEAKVQGQKAFRFFTLICYDWIGSLGSRNGILEILEQLNALYYDKPDAIPIHFCFLLQRNEKPNHPSFLSNIFNFFHDTGFDSVNRDKCAVVALNNAGKLQPGICEKYGFSGLIFSSSASYSKGQDPRSYAVNTINLRGSDSLLTCKDALFRESGGCIFSFRLIHPLRISGTPQDRRLPLEPSLVYPLDKNFSDPRTPEKPVPAIVKWVNDNIETICIFSGLLGPIGKLVSEYQKNVADDIRQCEHNYLRQMMTLSTVGINSNVDYWSVKEKKSLESILFALSFLRCAVELKIENSVSHAYFIKKDRTVVHVFVVTGGADHRKNIEYAQTFCSPQMSYVTLIISRDEQETPVTDRDKPIYEVDETDNIIRCGFHDLKDCLKAKTAANFKKKIMSHIG